MNLLVMGGTQFIGRHFAEAAIRAGHHVTLFHRGSKGVGSISGAEDILGDRTENLDRLTGRTWDVVMDSSAYLPAAARQSGEVLADVCGRYIFVSSVSVYAASETPPTNEASALAPIGDPNTTEVNGETYGYLKVLCEREVDRIFGARALIVRPGIVAGSLDPTNRFTYWVMRFLEGGEVVVPEVLASKLELIDARDLANFMLTGAEQGLSGPYNAAGPQSTFGDMIAACQALNAAAKQVHVGLEELAKAQIRLGADLPLATEPGDDALFGVSSAAAEAAGLRCRPLLETAHDVIDWKREFPSDAPPRAGMSRERELSFLKGLSGGQPA